MIIMTIENSKNLWEVIDNAILTSLSLIVGLLWKDALFDTITLVFPQGEGIFYKFLSAIIITVVVFYFYLKIRNHAYKLMEKIKREENKNIDKVLWADELLLKKMNIIEKRLKKIERKKRKK